MEYFSGIAGNESLKEYFSAHLRGGRLAHAYLFVGPSGSGKTNFALALAAAMACRDTVYRPCGQCGNCRKILRMQCADLTVVTADGSLSAHYENSLRVTDGEPEILTFADDI